MHPPDLYDTPTLSLLVSRNLRIWHMVRPFRIHYSQAAIESYKFVNEVPRNEQKEASHEIP